MLDLGSGGGIDVLLSARRVGPGGYAYGLDMTDEMLELARQNAAEAGATNVEFLKGTIESIPLPDASVDVVISNCVVNLAADKGAVFAEVARVLRPGGRIGITDIVAEDQLTRGSSARSAARYVGCIAGALSISEFRDGLRGGRPHRRRGASPRTRWPTRCTAPSSAPPSPPDQRPPAHAATRNAPDHDRPGAFCRVRRASAMRSTTIRAGFSATAWVTASRSASPTMPAWGATTPPSASSGLLAAGALGLAAHADQALAGRHQVREGLGVDLGARVVGMRRRRRPAAPTFVGSFWSCTMEKPSLVQMSIEAMLMRSALAGPLTSIVATLGTSAAPGMPPDTMGCSPDGHGSRRPRRRQRVDQYLRVAVLGELLQALAGGRAGLARCEVSAPCSTTTGGVSGWPEARLAMVTR